MMFDQAHLAMFVWSMIYAAFGVLMFAVVYWIITKVTPFSVRKEIEEDQNIALGVIIGSVILGVAIIIGSAITG